MFRDGKEIELKVKLGTLPENVASSGGVDDETLKATKALGLTLKKSTEEITKKAGYKTHVAGAMIVGVEAGSPAADGQLRPGLIITEVNNSSVSDSDEVSTAIAKSGKEGVVLKVVDPAGNQRFVFLKP